SSRTRATASATSPRGARTSQADEHSNGRFHVIERPASAGLSCGQSSRVPSTPPVCGDELEVRHGTDSKRSPGWTPPGTALSSSGIRSAAMAEYDVTEVNEVAPAPIIAANPEPPTLLDNAAWACRSDALKSRP